MMKDSKTSISFDEQVEQWVLDAVRRGIYQFGDLLTLLPGVYPSILLTALDRLVNAQLISKRILREAQRSASSPPLQALAVRNGFPDMELPIPHPLDYEWRFSEDAIERIMTECMKLSQQMEWIVLLGTPSLLRAAAVSSTARQFMLLDKNAAIVAHLAQKVPACTSQHFDAFSDDLPQVTPSVVVLDPPWYDAYFRAFLWVGSKLCDKGSHALLSLPPAGTRPSVLRERSDILRWSEQYGFTLTRLEPAALPYISPPFERNALRVEEIRNFPLDWRRGDLAVLKQVKEASLPRPEPPPREEQWTEQVVQSVRFRIRPPHPVGFRDPRLKTLVPGDVLPSVSRRDPRREQVDVWTSGNRVYRCEGRHTLQMILKALASDMLPEEVVPRQLGQQLSSAEMRAVLSAAHQIEEITRIERNENEQYNGA